MLNHGRLGGTGKLVILPVDQGFEHGPARSFAKNPAGYDPRYHFELAIDAGCNAYAAPLGFLEAGAARVRGRHPAHPEAQQLRLALRRQRARARRSPAASTTRCASAARRSASRSTRPRPRATRCTSRSASSAEEAKRKGLAVVVWSYPRGSGISKKGETAIDVVRLRRADRGAARRAHHQGEAADRAHRAGRGEEGLREASASRSGRSPSACATWCRARSTAAAS